MTCAHGWQRSEAERLAVMANGWCAGNGTGSTPPTPSIPARPTGVHDLPEGVGAVQTDHLLFPTTSTPSLWCRRQVGRFERGQPQPLREIRSWLFSCLAFCKAQAVTTASSKPPAYRAPPTASCNHQSLDKTREQTAFYTSREGPNAIH